MSDLSYQVVLQQSHVLGQEHQSSGGQEFLHFHELGQSHQLTDHNRIPLESRGPPHHDGSWS